MKYVIKKILRLMGYELKRVYFDDELTSGIEQYNEDGLTCNKNHDFIQDRFFINAYNRGIKSAEDYNFRWRVHICLWAAYTGSKLGGDFIECGVNKGFVSSAIMEYLDWNKYKRKFYLLDTFDGIDIKYINKVEMDQGVLDGNIEAIKTGFYTNNIGTVKDNFSEWKNVEFIQGSIPETLTQVKSNKIAYVHIDMNCAIPEAAAFDYFWNRIMLGGVIVFDDYGFPGHLEQKKLLDATAIKLGCMIASLPTGQGLVIKGK